jgi:hypothetical protein
MRFSLFGPHSTVLSLFTLTFLIDSIFRTQIEWISFSDNLLLFHFLLWNKEQGLAYSVTLAAQCAKSMMENLCEFKVSEQSLTLHVGIGAGTVSCIHVGGVENRIEFLIAGWITILIDSFLLLLWYILSINSHSVWKYYIDIRRSFESSKWMWANGSTGRSVY